MGGSFHSFLEQTKFEKSIAGLEVVFRLYPIPYCLHFVRRSETRLTTPRKNENNAFRRTWGTIDSAASLYLSDGGLPRKLTRDLAKASFRSRGADFALRLDTHLVPEQHGDEVPARDSSDAVQPAPDVRKLLRFVMSKARNAPADRRQ
jgi:hypothetical protein